METNFEAIVVGGGGSGLAAAVSSAENGLKTLLLEKQPFLGGTTGIAVGSLTANRTSLQTEMGIDDSLEAHAEDVAKFARPEYEAANNEPLRRYFLSRTAETYEWLREMGLSFYGPSPEPPNRVARMHNVVPNAKSYIAVLQSRFLRLSGTILCSCSVKGLDREEGIIRIVEAVHESKRVRFRASQGVVLAAGDYASAPDLIAKYKGAQYTRIEGINPHAGGDGQRLVEKAGGKLLNMGMTWGPEIRFIPPPKNPFTEVIPAGRGISKILGRLLPLAPKWLIAQYIKRLLVTWQHPDEKLFTDGTILLNKRGERFCNEKVFPQRELALAAQPEKIAYLLLDERLVNLYSQWPHFISTAPEIAYAYVKDYLKLRPGVSFEGRSLDNVAERRGFDPAVLRKTVEEFNRYAGGKIADPWGREGDKLPLEGGKWVLLGPAKAYFTITEGGAAINESMQALDEKGQPISGLYAVGCNGLGGQVLFGHGLHIAWAMTSGRIAGLVLSGKEG